MTEVKMNDVNQKRKLDRKLSSKSLIHTNSQSKLTVIPMTSKTPQPPSTDAVVKQDNQSSSKKFALWSKRVVKMVDVRRRLACYRPSTVTENFNEDGNMADDNFIKKIDESDIPINPRFPATMSLEAQYSYLKCYQDLISSQFQCTRQTKSDQDCSTSRNLQKVEEDKLLHLEPKFKMKTENTTFIPYVPSNKSSHSIVPTPIQQLSTSYRLQNAIDILDFINSSSGKSTFANHYQRHHIEPIKYFLTWKTIWKNDFEIKPKCH